jgi:hypothetical protein
VDNVVSIQALADVIRLAVAPVFLLAGIAGLLGVLSTRLGRIIDRARVVERRVPQVKGEEKQQLLRAEAASLWARTRLINWAIRLCVTAALTVSLVIVALFIGDFTEWNIAVLIALMFVGAMLFIISGLICFLREVGISIRQSREGIEVMLAEGFPELSE